MLKGKYAFYNYAIAGVEENQTCAYGIDQADREKYINPDLLILKYGIGGEKQFYFRKQDSYKLLQKILGQNYLDYMRISKEKFDDVVSKKGYLPALNGCLDGRAVVFVTEFENYSEYHNRGQNGVVGLTGIDLDGEYIAKEKGDLFPDNISYEDIYNYYEDAEEEREC